MWVVKLGGSLNNDPLLPEWLELLAQLGGGRVTLVCGGGGFADEVRRSQDLWKFDDLAAHNMAVLAMAQSGKLDPAGLVGQTISLDDAPAALMEMDRFGAVGATVITRF